ncbi:PhzF family phenazine biosynthesis protein [soil metagenome]
MRLPYRILNVFTVGGDRLSGNPLCVFEDGSGLDTDQMQALARQLNLSETTFIMPSAHADARVRIFTPGFEMPFAGHPTLGTAHVVRSLFAPLVGGDALTLEMIAGIVQVTSDGDRWTLRAAKPPVVKKPAATRAQLAGMIGLPESAIAADPLWIDTGSEQLVIPLATFEDVARAKPVPDQIQAHGLQTSRNEALAYIWAGTGDELAVRFFFTQHGAVIEDPATGSACANLGGYFLATGVALPLTRTLDQGAAVKRPSKLGLRVDADRGIYVSGNVIELGSGAFDV